MIRQIVRRYIQVVIASFVSIILIAPLAWMLLDRDPPHTFTHVDISPHDVMQGEDINITFTIKHGRRACGPGLVYREFRDSTGKLHVFDPVQRAVPPPRNEDQFTRIAKIPTAIEVGSVMYRGTACYSCNPLQSWLRWPVCVSTPEIYFNVLKKK